MFLGLFSVVKKGIFSVVKNVLFREILISVVKMSFIGRLLFSQWSKREVLIFSVVKKVFRRDVPAWSDKGMHFRTLRI